MEVVEGWRSGGGSWGQCRTSYFHWQPRPCGGGSLRRPIHLSSWHPEPAGGRSGVGALRRTKEGRWGREGRGYTGGGVSQSPGRT